MYRRDDPRLRHALDQVTQTVEAATEHAQENIYSFSQHYINPCFASIGNCFSEYTASCFPRDEERRRRRGQPRGRAESSFDFYDDWDEEEHDGLLSWGNSNDELDRLLGSSQPGRERAMSYGSRREAPRIRRTSLVKGDAQDSNIIPASHYLGFMDRLPWNLGRKGLRYKPSAADLQEHPGACRNTAPEPEQEPLIEDSEEEFGILDQRTHKRNRSGTATSGHTTSSLSSRGDLFPSDDEDDAVPLDDEFAMALERRTTNSAADEASSGKSRSMKSKTGSRKSGLSSRTVSSSTQGSRRNASGLHIVDIKNVPSLSELQAEEERARREEEALVEEKRIAANRLALQRGLSYPGTPGKPDIPRSPSPPRPEELDSKSPSVTGTDSFPAFDPSTHPTTAREETVSQPEISELEVTSPPPLPSPPPTHAEHFVPAALPNFSSSLN